MVLSKSEALPGCHVGLPSGCRHQAPAMPLVRSTKVHPPRRKQRRHVRSVNFRLVLPYSRKLQVVTQSIAEKIARTELYDRSIPDGLLYPSKLGSAGTGQGHCYALWPSSSIKISGVGSAPITIDTPGTKQAEKLHGIRTY